MVQLGQYFKTEYWDHFYNSTVKPNLNNHTDVYEEIRTLKLFEEDICQALAVLYKPMFNNDRNSFSEWLDNRIPALDNYTPREIAHQHDMNSIREYILRSR